jgi:NADH pyrophosphatase NudC (nudix superfamily)
MSEEKKMIYQCPGNALVRTPTLKIKKCPKCGTEVELASTDMKVDCPSCGQPIFNSINSCIDYCKYAEECLGTEIYQKYKKPDK